MTFNGKPVITADTLYLESEIKYESVIYRLFLSDSEDVILIRWSISSDLVDLKTNCKDEMMPLLKRECHISAEPWIDLNIGSP